MKKLTFILTLLALETVLQIVFAAVEAQHIGELSAYISFQESLAWQLKYVGTLKLVFCLPVYLIYYFIFNRYGSRLQTNFETARSHAVIFFISYMLGFVVLPFSLTFLDFVALPAIAFLSAFIVLRVLKKRLLL